MAESTSSSTNNSAVGALPEIQARPEKLVMGEARCALPKNLPACADSVAAFGKQSECGHRFETGDINDRSW